MMRLLELLRVNSRKKIFLGIFFLSLGVISGALITNIFRTFVKTKQVSKTALPTQKANVNLLIKGSIPYWDQKNAFTSFKNNVSKFDYINLFWYYITKDGTVDPYEYAVEDEQIINFAHANNVKVFAVITNLPDYESASWSSERVENVLQSESSQSEHIEDIVSLLKEKKFDGVTIDYESVEYSQKEKFTHFIEGLSNDLHEEKKIVAVALHPKNSGANEKSLGAFQDWKELSKFADHLNIMAYGEHYDEGDPGPIASHGWVKNILEYAKSEQMPMNKIFLGIPLYGYMWKENSQQEAKGLTFAEVEELKNEQGVSEEWDPDARSPYFTFQQDDAKYEVWFENAKSIKEKISLAKMYGLAGITFWRLGSEDPEIWSLFY